MITKDDLNMILHQTSEIAVATIDSSNHPNVRVVSFYYDNCNNIIYITTNKGYQKNIEFAYNYHIAFTTVPTTGISHAKAKGTIAKSNKKISELPEEFLKRIPRDFSNMDEADKNYLVYEIKFDEATITKSFDEVATIAI
ncbi:MAG: pyridoxamine 5'-phosphate oxidase family protein [Firmicutes bacterium]|nr:pyridoxamine 5'-phosphate oxidase family protein [Bacillota bacterium]